jgi:phospholipase C
MDGFTAANEDPSDPTGSRTMGYYDRRDLPFYYGLYSTFATSDRYFSSVLGPTFPNRFYLLAGTSFGHLRNDLPASPNDFSQKTIFNELDDAGVTWRVYAWQPPVAFSMIFSYVREHAAGHVFPISQYFTDAANGDLPDVSYIDPIFLGPPDVENDEHPPSNIQVGQLSVSEVVDALFHSPDWPSSALFLTYDEHGGFYDHVPPPAAVPPDGIPPSPLSATDVKDGFTAFDHYGIRVPAVVVSPYSRRHFVSHVTDDHTSILRFIETRFGLPALTARDAQADAMLGFFDFSRRSFATPPTLPAASVDPGQLAACATAPPNGGV